MKGRITGFERGERGRLTITIDTDDATVTVIQRAQPYRTRHGWAVSPKEYAKAPRVYVETPGETLLDNLANRTARPHTAWRPYVQRALAAANLAPQALAWSQRAGCSMCPCSPGFITRGPAPFMTDASSSTAYDVWVAIKDPAVPTVIEHARRLDVLAQLAVDPTMPATWRDAATAQLVDL